MVQAKPLFRHCSRSPFTLSSACTLPRPFVDLLSIWSFSLDPKLLEDQAGTLMSPTADSVPGLGMEGDKHKANDPVLDVPRDLLSITVSLVGESPGEPLYLLPWALQRDPWLKARGGAEVSGVIQRRLRGNLNHHCCREQVCQPCFLPLGRPPHPTPHGASRRTELLEFPTVCVTQS